MNSEDQELLDAWNELREAAGEEDLSGGVESRHATVATASTEQALNSDCKGSALPAQSLLIASRLHEKYFS